MRHLVPHDQQIDVAAGVVEPFGRGPVHEGDIDCRRQGHERSAQHVDQAERFLDQAAQLDKDRRVVIGLIVLLIADAFDGDDARRFEARKFALDRPRA